MAIARRNQSLPAETKTEDMGEIAQLMLDALTDQDGGEESQLEGPPVSTLPSIFQIQEH